MPTSAVLPGKPGTAYAAVRLHTASETDAGRLAELYAQVRPGPLGTSVGLRPWLANGAALFVQEAGGRIVAAIAWRAEGEGWRVAPIATLPSHRGLGYGRWLMTHLEALAIRGNVPFLALRIDDPELLPYYRRLGYRSSEDDELELRKRVGGTWQTQEAAR